MELILLIGPICCLIWLLRQIIYWNEWPKYFRNGSMRIVPGKDVNEFHIEMLDVRHGQEKWLYVTTLTGVDKVNNYVTKINDGQVAARKIFRKRK